MRQLAYKPRIFANKTEVKAAPRERTAGCYGSVPKEVINFGFYQQLVYVHRRNCDH